MDPYQKVVFDTPTVETGFQREQKLSFLTKLVIKASGGKVESATQAQYVLAGIALLFILITVLMFMKSLGASPSPEPLKEGIPPFVYAER